MSLTIKQKKTPEAALLEEMSRAGKLLTQRTKELQRAVDNYDAARSSFERTRTLFMALNKRKK